MSNKIEKYNDKKADLQKALQNKNFNKAIELLDFAEARYPGVKKNGTPHFQSQIEVCLFLTNLKEVDISEELIISNLLFETKEEISRYQKLSITLESYLKGKGYHKALEAFDFAKKNHPGFRKDGITPNFQHQIEIALFITTLKEVQFEEATIIAGLLHDVREDANIDHEEIKKRFGEQVADAVEKLTKEFKHIKKDTQFYFDQIATCPIASLVKLADRIHNVSTMVGVFTIPKQEDYVYEIKQYFFPLLKKARGNFPEQKMSYHSMQTFLKTMNKTVEAVLDAEHEVITLRSDNIDLKNELIEIKEQLAALQQLIDNKEPIITSPKGNRRKM